MDHVLKDRRAEVRFAPPARADIRATLRPGCDVQIVDVSGRGAPVRASRPLRPGGRVHLVVTIAARRVTVAAHVLRCVVWSLDASGVKYHGALRFDQEVAWRWAEGTRRMPVALGP
jgi:hypothetical protein